MAAPSPPTWRTLLSDPLTTLAGTVAAVAVLQALPPDKPATWILAASAFLGGCVARDKQRRAEEAREAEGKTDGPAS